MNNLVKSSYSCLQLKATWFWCIHIAVIVYWESTGHRIKIKVVLQAFFVYMAITIIGDYSHFNLIWQKLSLLNKQLREQTQQGHTTVASSIHHTR